MDSYGLAFRTIVTFHWRKHLPKQFSDTKLTFLGGVQETISILLQMKLLQELVPLPRIRTQMAGIKYKA